MLGTARRRKPSRRPRQEDRAQQQLRRQFLAPVDAEELGQGDQEGGGRRRRGGSDALHHLREPGHRAGRADPEPDPAGL